MLPLGGVLVAIFTSWLMSRSSTIDELGVGDKNIYKIWRFIVRYIAPLGVIIIFLNTMGFFKLFSLNN
jgi:NSS family neurotransmitter:Na+ symporter